MVHGFTDPDQQASAEASQVPRSSADVAEHGRNGFAYPAVDPGIPATPIAEVLATHRDLTDRIKMCYGVDWTTFERDMFCLIQRYAEFVHLLPATPDNYFNSPGGLLRMGLEVALFSLQGTDGHIFSGRSTITLRRHLEPRWRHATFIAGLCSELHRTLSRVIVTNDTGDVWPPYLMSLSKWVACNDVARFFVKWLPNAQESRALGVFALPHVIPADVMQHLASGNNVVVPHMLASLSGMPLYPDRNILDDLVRRSVALVIDRNLRASADRYGKPQLGSHLERYLVDALRRLVRTNPAWKPNIDKSRVWLGADGLFLVWPSAAVEMRALLEADQVPGIPGAAETTLEILLAAGVFEPQDVSKATWQIVPPGSSAAIEAVKVSSMAVLFGGIEPGPVPLTVPLVRAADDIGVEPSAPPSPAVDSRSRSGQKVTAGQLSLLSEQPDAARFRLNAPMRLNPGVRDALTQIIDTLNRDGSDVAACTISSGLFIPLIEFERRDIEPALAMRALGDVHMLVLSPGAASPAHARDFGSEQKVGLVLRPQFVAGLDPNDFNNADGSS